MKLTAKLPIALSMACALMLSSCSKEDVMTPQPKAEGVGEYSGAKTNAGEVIQSPYVPNTISRDVNWNLFPKDWQKADPPAGSTPIDAGSSTLTSLWGHVTGWSVTTDPKWIKPLPPVPSNPSTNSMVTTMSFTANSAEAGKRSHVYTTISNLQPGKTYSITCYVASTTVKQQLGNGIQSACAKSAEIKIFPADYGQSVTVVDLVGKEAQWIKKAITFKATQQTAKLHFSGLTPVSTTYSPYVAGTYSYTHLFIDQNAIKELTAFQPVITQPMNL